jgi:acetaldehyde dehydrogenase/alcohol dehydrogenase
MSEINVELMIDELVSKATVALEKFKCLNQEQIDYIVAKCSVAGLDHHGQLAMSAIKETKRGVFEDKATKNLFACEYVVNNFRHLKTVGVIHDDPVTGITEIAEPLGVLAGITPVTNPTSTVIFKALIALKTRNPIIFGFRGVVAGEVPGQITATEDGLIDGTLSLWAFHLVFLLFPEDADVSKFGLDGL